MTAPAGAPLAGWHVLVAEDEYLIAREIRATLTGAGAASVDIVSDLAAARARVAAQAPDAAVLDVKLVDDEVYALADTLIAAGTGVLFLTGYDVSDIPPRFADCPKIEKPFRKARLAEGLQALAKQAG